MSGERFVRVSVDRAACIGSGICVSGHPELFDIKDGRAVALTERVRRDEAVLSAAFTCPMEAIGVHDD